MRHRLYQRIYLTLLAFVLLALVLAALAGHLLLSDLVRWHLGGPMTGRATAMARELPAADRPSAELQDALERVTADGHLQATLWSRAGERLAFTSTDLPAPPAGESSVRWLYSSAGPALAVPLADGRTLVLRPRRLPRPAGFLVTLALLAGLLAVASHPVARLVTRRLEALESGVRRLGEGDLDARVVVEGDDELASLASSFNHTAGRLQGLVEAQRRVLASASHELRSPLARLRLAVELARDNPAVRSARLDEAVAEVAELDSLVEELLLAGRLELQEHAPAGAPVDLAALVAEEAARAGATADCRPVEVHADVRLLRVLVRNLLENARRHAGGAVEIGAEPAGEDPGGARIWVADRGPGVPEAEREPIFEPFYRPGDHAEGRDGGVGLGLYLVRRIAERHGGSATCRPRDGGGTVFEVVLGGRRTPTA